MPYNLNIPGGTAEGRLKIIEQLAKKASPNSAIVEVGSLFGRSAWCWAKSCDPSVEVFCIDPWDLDPGFAMKYTYKAFRTILAGDEPPEEYPTKQDFLRNTADCPNITAIQAFSPVQLNKQEWLDKEIDIVFIDSDHHLEWVTKELEFWSEMNPKILCGDDFTPTLIATRTPGVIPAVIDYCTANNRPLIIQNGIWITYRDDLASTEALR